MIDLIQGFPGNVVAVSAHGLVNDQDHRALLDAAVEAAARHHDRIRLFYEIGPNFTGFDLNAVFSHTRIEAGRKFHWEKVALLTDVPWIRDAAWMFSILIPAEIRTFDVEEADDAKAWIIA